MKAWKSYLLIAFKYVNVIRVHRDAITSSAIWVKNFKKISIYWFLSAEKIKNRYEK